ncbi:MAG: transaldolase, partial [Chloroflexi bacterium]|nr:transaldolase [Chloroflexota bacterium]
AQANDVARRLWPADLSLWPQNTLLQNQIAHRLGWLRVAEAMRAGVSDLAAWSAEVAEQVDDVVLLGMGGSSLAPEVMAAVIPQAEGSPQLTVLDTTDPSAIRRVESGLDLDRSLFIVASKSGGTLETATLAEYFWSRYSAAAAAPGRHFVAITDPGTSLASLAQDRAYARVFLNPPDIGGRYSALSFFGLVPAALAGIDLEPLLDRAIAAGQNSAANPSVNTNPPITVGVALGALAGVGRDKLTLVPSASLRPVGAWVEQLVAESAGKEGQGVVPVDGEPLGGPGVYGNDRVFVELALAGDPDDGRAARLDALAGAGHPVITLPLDDPHDLGAHFLTWELATAVAGSLLDINPFDQPSVAESKDNTDRVLGQITASGAPFDIPAGPRANGVLAAGSQAPDLTAALTGWLSSVHAGDYISIQAYLDRTSAHDAGLRSIQALLRDALHRAVTLGYGPRFLHSTGQLHKGGPDTGVFLQITADHQVDVEVPGRGYSFGTLIDAQAIGDLESLAARERRRLRLHLTDSSTDLETVASALRTALNQISPA